MSKYNIPDYHLHTLFSGDCDTPLEDIIASALGKGLTSMCITDHNDLDFPIIPHDDDGNPISFDLDIDSYIPRLLSLQKEVLEKYNFDLRIGVEQGVMPSTCGKLESYSKEHPELDFIICSTHIVDDMDPYYPEFWEGKDPMKCYLSYFETTLYNAEHFEDYNVYGHLDYILRYGPCPKQKELVDIKPFMEIIEAILKAILDHGKGIEINTGSLYRGMDYSHPHTEVLKLYKELGGEILTFGSDAHDSIHIAHDFDTAADMAKALGFKYYCKFKNMKPDFINL